MTKKATEGTKVWKQLFEQAQRDRVAAIRKSDPLTRQSDLSVMRSRPIKPSARLNTETTRPRGETARNVAEVSPTKKVDPMPERLTLVLPIQLLSKNARDKLHYQAKNRLRKDYQSIIETKYPRRGEPTPQVRQRATITRILGPRERRFDQQNIGAGSAIELVDALTASGYWVNDSEKWLETRFEQTQSKAERGPAVRVEIAPL